MDNLKESLDNWAEVNKRNFEIDLVESLFLGSLVASSIIDKFSTWLLAGTGAIAALMIVNVDKLAPVLGVGAFKYSIYWLLISGLFGLLAKYKSLDVQITLAIRKEIKTLIEPIAEKFETDEDKILNMSNRHGVDVKTAIDPNNVCVEYSRAFPFFLKPWLKKQFDRGLNDRLYSSRKVVNGLFWQSNYVVLQVFMFVWFVYYSVSNLDGI